MAHRVVWELALFPLGYGLNSCAPNHEMLHLSVSTHGWDLMEMMANLFCWFLCVALAHDD